MAKTKGSYQRKLERKSQFSAVFSVAFFLIGLFLFSYLAIQSAVNVSDIDHDRLNTYAGSCAYRVIIHRRGATYVFTLGNGHEVHVGRSDVQNTEYLDSHDQLVVRYTTMYSNPLHRMYGAVSITSMDGSVEFVSMEESRRQSAAYAWISSILTLVYAAVTSLLIVIAYGRKWKNWYRKHRKQIQKKRNHYLSDA